MSENASALTHTKDHTIRGARAATVDTQSTGLPLRFALAVRFRRLFDAPAWYRSSVSSSIRSVAWSSSLPIMR